MCRGRRCLTIASVHLGTPLPSAAAGGICAGLDKPLSLWNENSPQVMLSPEGSCANLWWSRARQLWAEDPPDSAPLCSFAAKQRAVHDWHLSAWAEIPQTRYGLLVPGLVLQGFSCHGYQENPSGALVMEKTYCISFFSERKWQCIFLSSSK